MKSGNAGKGTFWALVPVGLLGGLVTMVLGAVHVAVSDPSFAVRDRYYARALSWDEHLAAERRSIALGWHADVATAPDADGTTDLTLSLVDRDGRPVRGASVELEAFPIARARQTTRATFVEQPSGGYRARLAATRGGRWEMAIDATRGADRFASVLRRDLAGPPR